MNLIRAVLARIAGFFNRHRGDADLREELEAHLEMETAEYIRRGMHPDAARRKALLASGGLTQAAEAVREQRGLPWLESIVADIRYAHRALRQSKAFTTVVVITLALGIGANTAIFSVVRGVLLKPLPHRDGERLVYLRQSTDSPGGASVHFSIPEVRDLRRDAPSLSGIAEYSPWFHTLQLTGGAMRMDGALVTGNYFDVMGLSPVLGRLTRPGDDGPRARPVMVLTYDFWRRRFGGDFSIVGKQVSLDGTPVTVIGVLQPAPFFPDHADAFLNTVVSPHHLSATMIESRSHRMTQVVARLAPGVTLDDARAEVNAAYERMQRVNKESYPAESHFRIAVVPYRDALAERARLTLSLLMGVAAFVLIISAANVANLTLMRAVRREQELVVRAALGAGVARLRRLLLVENLMLALLGAIFGVGLALGGVRVLRTLVARYSPRASDIRLDLPALGFTLALSVAVALLLSFLASLPKEGTFASWISAGMRRMGGGLSKQRLQRALVIAQVAVSVVLLAGAGLLTQTVVRMSHVDTGLRYEEVLTVPVPLLNPTRLDDATDARAKTLYDRMRREIRTLPGVTEVGLGSTMPLRTTTIAFDLKREGYLPPPGEPTPHAEFRTASPEYFRASGIPLLKGREFTPEDRPGSDRVVIVNKTFADRFFPGESPVGKRIAWTGEVLRFTPVNGDWRTIVGVVGNTQDGGPSARPRAVVFAPFSQEFTISGGLVIRADSDASQLATAATRIVRRIAPGVPIDNVLTISQIRDQSVAPSRLNAMLISLFGVLAVIVAAVGIGGVLAFSVTARTTEIGIRMSLGAGRGQMQRMILKEGGVLLGAGLVLGIATALLATRIIRGLLFGVAPYDPATFGVVALLMATIGVGACWLPARRAARVDPVIAMRA